MALRHNFSTDVLRRHSLGVDISRDFRFLVAGLFADLRLAVSRFRPHFVGDLFCSYLIMNFWKKLGGFEGFTVFCFFLKFPYFVELFSYKISFFLLPISHQMLRLLRGARAASRRFADRQRVTWSSPRTQDSARWHDGWRTRRRWPWRSPERLPTSHPCYGRYGWCHHWSPGVNYSSNHSADAC